MSTVRIQVRRGTASDWTSVNPILAGGEIGFETNTGKLKIGDGTTSWSSLDYVASDVPAVGEIAMDAINSALTMGSGISKSYDDGADEITLENTGVLSFNTRTGNVTLSANDVNGALGYTAADSSDLTSLGNQTSSDITNAINVAENYTDSAISAEETARNSAIATAKSQAISTANEYTDNSLQLNIIDAGNLVMTPVDSDKITIAVNDNPNFSGTLNANAITVGDITSDGTLTATDINVTGNLTVSGTTTTVDSTNLNITDPMVYLGSDNQSNVLDLGFVGSFNDGTYQHSGLVRDASDGTWKLFSGVVSEPTTTVDFSTYTKDSLQLDGLDAERAKIGDVTNAQIQRLHGVTSNIQDQIDSKASTTYVNQNFVAIESGTLNNPNLQSSSIYNSTISNSELINAQLSGNTTVSDSITLPASSILETNIANGAVTNSKLSTNAVTNAKVANNAAIDYLKLNLEDSIKSTDIQDDTIETRHIQNSSVTSEKIDSVAQSQVTGLSDALALKADKNSPTFTGTVTLPSGTVTSGMIADGTIVNADINSSAAIDWTKLAVSSTVSSTEIEYLDGVTSAVQTQIDAKASSSSLTAHTSATTNVHGISDTSALATKTYADGKASDAQLAAASALASHEADTTNIHGITDTSKLVTTDGTQTLTNKTITSPSGLVKADVGLGNVNNTSDANKPVSTATQTALDLKADLAGPTFTGTVTLPSTTSIGNVSATELGYVDGVTSAIQTQLDAKLASATAASTYAPIASPTFTGTVSGVTKSMVGLGNVDNTSDANKPVSTATQTALDAKLALAGGTMTGALTLSGDPTSDLHAVTKQYVDSAVTNINIHEAVKAATTANITLSGTQTIDGVAVIAGDRVLVKNQSTGSANGVYLVASGSWTRATDYNSVGEVSAGDFIFVTGGTVNANTGWVQTAVISTLGTDSLSFTQFSGAGTYTASTGLSLSGTSFAIDSTVATLTGTQTLTNKTLTSPTLTAPVLGTPASGTLTNATGLPISTGVSGLGTGVATFLATPSSSNLASAVTDETGSGALVFATSPTLVTPTIGAATATSVNGTTIPTSKTLVVTTDKLSVHAATTSAELAGVISDETGTGALVFANSPTLVTPALGTPASGVLTNATGLPLTTGVTGTLPVANGGTGVTTSTGSGNVVLSTSPTLVTPTLGAASATSIAFSDGTQTLAGTPSLTPINTQTASITLSSSFAKDSFVQMNVASANTITIPPDSTYSYGIGASIDFQQLGAGQTSFVAGAGVTLQAASINGTAALKFRGQYSVATALKVAANTWALFGDLSI